MSINYLQIFLYIIFILTFSYVFFRMLNSLHFRIKSFFNNKIYSNSRFQMFGEYYYKINTSEKVVALTFDDGPLEPYTDKLLAVLEKHQVPATFFFIGRNVEKYPECVKRVLAKGHVVANHSYSHPAFIGLSKKIMLDEIEKTDNILRSVGVNGEILFRAPYGKKFLMLPYLLWKKKKKHILFDFFPNPRDFNAAPVEEVANSVINQSRPGSIIVLHDGNLKAAPLIDQYTESVIIGLKEKGYRFLGINEILKLHV